MNAADTMQVDLTREPVREVAAFSIWRLMKWQVRKEVWEHRGLWVAPAATAVVMFLIWLVTTIYASIHGWGYTLQGDALTGLFTLSGVVFGAVVFFVAAFYCLDALYGERRERTVLFWKSMPVSDNLTVVSKFLAAMVVVPAAGFIAKLVLSVLIWASAVMVLLCSHVSATDAIHSGLLPTLLDDAYAAVAVTLWYAPIYAVFLLISALAKKSPILWVIVPVAVTTTTEKMIWHTRYVSDFLQSMFAGVNTVAWSSDHGFHGPLNPWHKLQTISPGVFLASPHLWIGFVAAAAMLFLAARVRRSQIAN